MLRAALKIALVAGAAALAMHSATATAAGVPVYTVKFVCGTQSPQPNLNAPAEPPVKPGNYATVINIEALTPEAGIFKILSIAGASPLSMGTALINRFNTVDITCADIAKLAGSSASAFITGYVNIEVKGSIQVTAVYSSQGCAFVGAFRPVCSGQPAVDVVPQQPQSVAPNG